ncbi:MAG TPA: hypothetical protein VFO39_00280 [Candidatus Sulfotelmatobacter sp.]|nr:hypothetical protein [Candidatus Sulfotelmatobacter sp.]
MAAVGGPPGLLEQVWLVGRVRWLMTRRTTYRTVAGATAGVVFRVIGFAGTAIVAAVFGLLAYLAITDEKRGGLLAIYWGMFALWQLAPFRAIQLRGSFDSTPLLRFPMRFSTLCALNLAFGLGDPSAIAGVARHLAVMIAIIIARPDAWRAAVLVTPLSIVMNLFCSQMLNTWLERLLAQRKTREIALALFALLAIGLQFSRFIAAQVRGPATAFFQRTYLFWTILPPGEAGASLNDALSGHIGAGLRAAGSLALYSGAFAGLLIWRLQKQFRGEYLGETAAALPVRETLPLQITKSREVALPRNVHAVMPEKLAVTSGIFVKELKYLRRNSMALMNLFRPLILVVFIAFSWRQPSFRDFGVANRFAFPEGLAFVLVIVTAQLCLNSLAYDGSGVQLLLMAPIDFREVMLGKNLYHAVVIGIEIALVLAIVWLLLGPPGPLIISATILGAVFESVVLMTFGNWRSLKQPRALQFGTVRAAGKAVRTQKPSAATRFMGLGIIFGSIALLAAIAAVANWISGGWSVLAAYFVLDLVAFSVYRTMLAATSQLAMANRDELLGQLAR